MVECVTIFLYTSVKWLHIPPFKFSECVTAFPCSLFISCNSLQWATMALVVRRPVSSWGKLRLNKVVIGIDRQQRHIVCRYILINRYMLMNMNSEQMCRYMN